MSSSYEEVMESNNFLPFHLDHLTPRMVQMAKEELNENEETRSSSIEQLRKLVIKEKYLKSRTDDEFLLQFLRARKFNVKNAFARLQTLYEVFSKSFADVFANINDERATKAFNTGFGCHLPYRDREGAAVVLMKMRKWKVEDFDICSLVNCGAALWLSAADYPATQVCGQHLLIDIEGTTLQHLMNLRPRFLKLFTKAVGDTLPVRFKGIHLINASRIFRYIWSIINIFLSEKIRKRVHFHDDNMESLHKFLPKEILPTEYGGDSPNFDPVVQGSEELEKFLPKYLRIIHDGYRKN